MPEQQEYRRSLSDFAAPLGIVGGAGGGMALLMYLLAKRARDRSLPPNSGEGLPDQWKEGWEDSPRWKDHPEWDDQRLRRMSDALTEHLSARQGGLPPLSGVFDWRDLQRGGITSRPGDRLTPGEPPPPPVTRYVDDIGSGYGKTADEVPVPMSYQEQSGERAEKTPPHPWQGTAEQKKEAEKKYRDKAERKAMQAGYAAKYKAKQKLSRGGSALIALLAALGGTGALAAMFKGMATSGDSEDPVYLDDETPPPRLPLEAPPPSGRWRRMMKDAMENPDKYRSPRKTLWELP